MRVDIHRVLTGLQPALFTQIVPALGNDYSAGSAVTIGMSLNLVAQEIDRSVEILVTANGEMRDLFAQAAGWIRDAALGEKLAQAAASPDGSLRVSALGAANDRLSRMLIELQAYVEEQDGPDARHMERQILTHLQASARRELLEFPSN
jgi:hypothetical protein